MQDYTRKTRAIHSLLVVLLFSFLSSGCADENDPKYWGKKIKQPAYRERAIKMLGELYDKALQKANFNKDDQEVKKIKDEVIPILLEAFNKYKTDNINRSNIITILARMGDRRAIPAFEELLDYQEGINETDASKGAEALGDLGSVSSIPKIVAMVRKAQTARRARGEGARNRPEEDWITRSAISGLRKILIARPDAPNKDEAVQVLIDILGTTADEQDFFLNMKAAIALGDIGDPKAIPILIRGLFMQGRGATIYQQCRVALTKIAVEHRKEVIDWLLKAYRGEFSQLEADSVKYQFIKGVKEDKIGRIFAELKIRQDVEKEIFDEMMKRLENPDPAISGFTAISLGKLNYKPALKTMIKIITDKNVHPGVVPGIIEAFEYYQEPKKTVEILFNMMSNKEKWDKTYRLRAALALSRIAGGQWLEKYQKQVSEEPEEDVRKEMVTFTERLTAARQCGDNVDCWINKLSSSSWREQEKAIFTLLRLYDKIPPGKINDITYMLRSTNQDILKTLMLLIDKIHPGGCVPQRTCDRLKKIIPYWRAKPQFKVRANDAECQLARLIWRQGGKLEDMRKKPEK